MSPKILLSALPPDIFYIIFHYLSPKDFLSLTASCKKLLVYRDDFSYWHTITRNTFRIPYQPLLKDFQWREIYKKLLTETKLYTWGDNKSGNLGIDPSTTIFNYETQAGAAISQTDSARSVGFPLQVKNNSDLEQIGIISDVQCGGWSTVVLNSIGALSVYGNFNERDFIHRQQHGFRRLGFPKAYPTTTKERYEPSTAIQQFSTGRRSVLGLADDGKVWMWNSNTGFQVKPTHIDLAEHKVEKVVAGWDRESMYVNGVGIVYWSLVQDNHLAQEDSDDPVDAMMIETVTIPGTGFQRHRDDRLPDGGLGSRIGQVTNYVVQSRYIVFATDLNKIFCYYTTFPMPEIDLPEPIELTTFYNAIPNEPFVIREIQGAFIRFAIFTASNSIILGTEEFLNAYYELSRDSDPPNPTVIPSLQTKDIVSLAFGDWHFHALRNNGTITSYGMEMSRCGALGLGDRVQSYLRGVKEGNAFSRDCLPDGEGRRIWFEPLMSVWLNDEIGKTKDTVSEARARAILLFEGDPPTRQAYADYFEREGSKWEESVTKPNEMGAHFVLKVAAAGWHSAALVLVDEDLAKRARYAHLIEPANERNSTSETVDSRGHQILTALLSEPEAIRLEGHRFITPDNPQSRRGIHGRLRPQRPQRPQEPQRPVSTEASSEGSGRQVEERWFTWNDKPFPRLRLPDGTPMSGEVPLME